MRALALLLAAAPGPALACGLELILAVDVSGSVDEREFRLQMEGIAAAFETEAIGAAAERTAGGLLVTLTQWSGTTRQRSMTGWHAVADRGTARAFGETVRAIPRAWRNFSTAIGQALQHAAEVSATAPAACQRRVIDVSGDGVSNEGVSPRRVAAQLVEEGYTVNGLAIRGAEPDPVDHYRNDVIAGPGAFVEVAENFDDYPRAILRKLLREIEQPLLISATP